MVEQAACVGGAVDAVVEGGGVVWAIVHEAAEDGVVAEGGEDLAGHVGGEAGDVASLEGCPFRVGAGEAYQGVGAGAVEDAGDLDFLAAHDFGGFTVGVREAGDEAEVGGFEGDVDRGFGQGPGVGGAGEIGGFDPALAAADHAGHEDLAFAGLEPWGDRGLEGVGEAGWGDGEDARAGGDAVEDLAALEAEGSEAGGAPVDCDHGGVLAQGWGLGQAMTYSIGGACGGRLGGC